ncbi:MAG TPA: hypothetical protein PKE04_22880, partial [Clostridia bacterium]|nr:hypothetical protein [Clostridia bacterium]
PEGSLLLLSGCGGAPFVLAPDLCGLCFKAIEWDLPRLANLRGCLEDGFGLTVQISVGRVGRAPEGFAVSLGEALEAAGVLFESRNGLRLYRPVDETALAWIMAAPIETLAEALDADAPEALEACLNRLCDQATQLRPSPFALRLMAKTLETLLLLRRSQAGQPAQARDFLRPLWASETLANGPWLEAFCRALRAVRSAPDGPEGPPAPVRAVLETVETAYCKPLALGDIASEPFGGGNDRHF